MTMKDMGALTNLNNASESLKAAKERIKKQKEYSLEIYKRNRKQFVRAKIAKAMAMKKN